MKFAFHQKIITTQGTKHKSLDRGTNQDYMGNKKSSYRTNHDYEEGTRIFFLRIRSHDYIVNENLDRTTNQNCMDNMLVRETNQD
jgi:hypothetical protein